MIIHIKVIPNSSKENVEKQEDGTYRVYVKEKPIKGKANSAVRKIIAEYFAVPVRDISIQETTSRKKKITIKDINT